MSAQSSILRRHPDFRRLWLARAVSLAGSTVSREAIPYTAILTLAASPLQMGLLGATATAPALLLGLFVGVWVDRFRRRRLMIAADLVRTALIVTIPVAWLLGHLTIGQLFVVAALTGVLTVAFDVSSAALVPSLLAPGELLEANSALGVSESVAEIVGPPAGGGLVQFIGGPLTLLLDAVSFVFSAVTLRGVRDDEAPSTRSETSHFWPDLTSGLRVIRADRRLLALAAGSAHRSFFGWFFGAVYALYAIRVVGTGTAILGVTVALGGVGALVGALVVRRVTARIGIGPSIVVGAVVASSSMLLIWLAGSTPLVLGIVLLMMSQLIGDSAETVASIGETTLRQTITAGPLLGRVTASMTVLGTGVGTLGMLAGGILGEWLGLTATVAIAALGSLSGCLWLVASPLPTTVALPEAGAATD